MRKFAKRFVFILLIITFLLLTTSSNNSNSKINNILRSKYYSYLPKEAQDYIKEVYEDSGEIILTEKNKKVNTPYLNPQYINYLTLDEKEKEEVEVIPNTLKLDYSPQKIQGDSLTTYDLRNVSGNSYISPLKNQKSLGICWAFSTIEQAESYLMVNNGIPYNSSSEIFSVRQLDYAASDNGINYYENENGYRNLADGGNFYMSSFIMANGLSLVPEEYMPINYDMDKKELVEVLNYGNSSYEVNSTIMMPALNDNYTSDDLNEYVNLTKSYIRQYGGAYVGTGSPQGACGSKNTDGKYIIADTTDCNTDTNYSGHAMQIIGWDDNYNYSYCLSGTKHLNVNSSGTCSTGTLKTGTGAWIIRNSWGDDPDYKYLYMSYNSNKAEIDFITSLEDMETRTWDNNYHNNPWSNNSGLYSIVDIAKFTKTIPSSEKLEKVKFISLSQNGKFKISVRSGSTTYSNIVEVTVPMPGIYTVDLSSYNISLDSDDFYVTVMSSNGSYILMNTISAFTSNTTSTPMIKTEDVMIDGVLDEYIAFPLYSLTKNIPSNAEVNFSLWKGSTNYSSYLEDVLLNYVAENNMNTYIFINSSIPSGDYKIKTEYGGYSYYSNLKINGVEITEGSGTKNDPYIIYNESQLNALRYGLDKAFKLGSDITLTEPWIPVGTESEPFKGIFDGDGHTINGLVVNDSATYNGLFGYVEGNTSSDYSVIKNVTIKNANVSGNSDTGILIGRLNIGDSEYATVSNINIIGGTSISTNGNAGSILGNFTSVITANSVTMYQIFSSASILGKSTAGLIGNLDQFADLKMYLFENIGEVKTNGSIDNYHNGIIGKFHNEVMWLELYDFIVTNRNYFNTIYNGHLLQQKLTNKGGKYNKSGIYLKTDNDTINHNIQTSDGDVYNISDITDLKDDNIKSNFKNDFDTYFKTETIDGIKRIPILKGAEIDYTSISDIDLEVGDTVSLLDYITPTTDASRIHFTTQNDEDIITVSYEYNQGVNYPKDVKITALKRGVTTLHVVSDYDGYERDITITNTGGNVNVTKPDGTIEVKPYNSTYELGTNNIVKVDENIGSVTFKYQDGRNDTTSYVTKSFTPDKWLVNGEVVNNNVTLLLTDDIVIEPSYIETVQEVIFDDIVREHYTFDGWYDSSENQITSYNGTNNIIVYAHWTGDEVTVTKPNLEVETYHYGDTYELGENKIEKASINLGSVTFKYQDLVTADTIELVKRKYTPNGWLVNEIEKEDNQMLVLTENIVITPNYTDKIEPVIFEDAERNNYTFDGWFDEEENGNEVTSYNGVENIIVYAHWSLSSPTDFELDSDDLLLLIGGIHQVEATFTPNGTEDTLIYSGYDNEILSITEEGLITALAPGETEITVALESNESITKTINVKVVEDKILSDNLNIDSKDLARIIIGEEPNTKLEDFLNKMDNDLDYISVYTEEDELIEDMETIVKTGMKLKLTINGQVQDEVVVIIRGDIDGDGLVNITDAGIMKQHIIEVQAIEGFRLYAADLDEDPNATIENMITVSDSGILKRYIIEAIDTLN